MKNVTVFSGGWTLLSIGVAALALSGCSPTYGTGTPASVQLLDDLSSAATIEGQQNTDIAYKPRPGLVPPPEEGTLPPPQTSVAETERWPESPEETRARLRAEAAATGDASLLASADSNLPGAGADAVTVGGAANGPPAPGTLNDAQSRQRYLEAQQVARATSPSERNFLSEPPLEYRRPAETAPVGELGETERTKQRRREAAAEKGEGGWWPF